MSFRSAFRLAIAASIVLPLVVTPTWAAKLSRITMEPGDQKTWAQRGEVVRAATANERVVGVNVVPPRGVVLTAKSPGTAMVSIWEAGKNTPSTQYRVVVTFGAQNSRDALGPDQGLARADSVGPALRLSGELSSLERHETVASTLEATAKASGGGGSDGGGLFGRLFGGGGSGQSAVVDSSRSAFDVQVQLDVKIVEVSRGKLKSSGFYADRFSGNTISGISGPSNLSGLITNSSGVNTQVSSTGFIPQADAFNIFRWGANSLTVFSALENNGFAYVLAEPSLTAISGQTANFLAGGEIPIPFRSGTGESASVYVVWKEFGIRLGMTPTVLDNNRITIKVAPEVSEIDSSLSITAGGLSIPGLRVRRTETTVAAGDGETFIISGLVSQQSTADIDKFPFLGDIPILGAFFKSSRFDKTDKELMMIITPRLVRPFAKEARLPALPGEEIKDYDPGYLRFLFLENGKFATPPADSGFSR